MATSQQPANAQDAAGPASTPFSASADSSLYDSTLPHHGSNNNNLPPNPSQGASSPQTKQQTVTHQGQQPQHQQRSVKRPRPVKSCTECRKRKLRCDRLLPCSQCEKSGRTCKYAADHDPANMSDGSDAEAQEPIRPAKRAFLPGGAPSDAANAPSRNGDTHASPGFEELAQRMERLERHLIKGSPAGPEMTGPRLRLASPSTLRGLSVKKGGTHTRFFGQNEPRVMLNLFDEAKAFLNGPPQSNHSKEVMTNFKKLHKLLSHEYHQALAPITVFVDSMMPIHKRMRDILPKRPVCDRLIAGYIDTCETIYRIIHPPTFMEQYNLFWEGKLQDDSFLPQLLAVCSVGSRFETKSRGLGHERAEGVHIPTSCALVRSWLGQLKGNQLTDIVTLQVELLLLQVQRMIQPRAHDSWVALGSVVRLAITMGLQRDPDEFDSRLSVFRGEIRRRLWYTLLDMDLHISLACSLPCTIRDGDFTTRAPGNLNDADLFPDMVELPPSNPIDQFTDNQMQVYAAMTLGIRLKAFHLINNADHMRDFNEVVELGHRMDRYLEDINHIFPRHGILNDTQKSKLWRTRVILDMLVRRPLLALYRPFAIGLPDPPPQISRAYLRSSMVILKYLDEIDPMMAHYQAIVNMYYQVLKRDIMEASLGVCCFIRSASRNGTDGTTVDLQAPRLSPDSVENFPSYVPESLMLWSTPRLISTVQKTVDLWLTYIGSNDLKAIVCLATALETSINPGATEIELCNVLRAVFNRCLQAADVSMESLNMAAAAAAHKQVDQYQADLVMQPRAPSYGGMYQEVQAVNFVDFDNWVMWSGWDELG